MMRPSQQRLFSFSSISAASSSTPSFSSSSSSLCLCLCRSLHTARPTIAVPRPRRAFHQTSPASLPRKRTFFTSNVYLSQNGGGNNDASPNGHPRSPSGPFTHDNDEAPSPVSSQPSKRKVSRSAGAKNSLRRVAIIAQRPAAQRPSDPQAASRTAAWGSGVEVLDDATPGPMTISAVCVAEAFDMAVVLDILRSHGFAIDPDSAGFEASEVAHARGVNGGDIFVFPSGTIVTWSLPPDVVTKQLMRAAEVPLGPELREVEHLEYIEDGGRDTSVMKGDVVVLGTGAEARNSSGSRNGGGSGPSTSAAGGPGGGGTGVGGAGPVSDRLETTLAKIAFSSGLARSTKLAVLESALTAYFESTRNIPNLLSRGSGVPLGRKFILQKTGELLSLRARLNHYSELTDSLPDIFWDSRSELGLEGYYEQVGRALDVNVRIRTLNQKMDYAQEIAAVLREMSSEQHNTRLELIIIVLIAVEVVFELRRIVLEWMVESEEREASQEAEAAETKAKRLPA